ncbi:hypothetical protein BJY52DRAFT_1312160 [Lactarius psammicola]|nr:hypothetical protein BJY52DRAFT_1312160 [Lactarius psammicola]
MLTLLFASHSATGVQAPPSVPAYRSQSEHSMLRSHHPSRLSGVLKFACSMHSGFRSPICAMHFYGSAVNSGGTLGE